MQYFGEPEGRVKMQMMSFIIQFIIQRFRLPKILTCQGF